MARHQRHFSSIDEEELLRALEIARSACTSAMGKAPINGRVYIALTQVTEAIAEVCVATGRKREHFFAYPPLLLLLAAVEGLGQLAQER
jgi:hypothetical protein